MVAHALCACGSGLLLDVLQMALPHRRNSSRFDRTSLCGFSATGHSDRSRGQAILALIGISCQRALFSGQSVRGKFHARHGGIFSVPLSRDVVSLLGAYLRRRARSLRRDANSCATTSRFSDRLMGHRTTDRPRTRYLFLQNSPLEVGSGRLANRVAGMDERILSSPFLLRSRPRQSRDVSADAQLWSFSVFL